MRRPSGCPKHGRRAAESGSLGNGKANAKQDNTMKFSANSVLNFGALITLAFKAHRMYVFNEVQLIYEVPQYQLFSMFTYISEDPQFEEALRCERNGCSSTYGGLRVFEGTVPGQQHLRGRVVQMACVTIFLISLLIIIVVY